MNSGPIKPTPVRLLTDSAIVVKMRELANSLPCQMCSLKNDINNDGSCRHNPVTDNELVERITVAVNVIKKVYADSRHDLETT